MPWQPFKWPDEDQRDAIERDRALMSLARSWGLTPAQLDEWPLEDVLLAIRMNQRLGECPGFEGED